VILVGNLSGRSKRSPDLFGPGPKAMGGFATTDNGYAVFDHIRIPARYMLSKFAHVTEDGRYVQPPHAKISYGGVGP
jgi:acyl-CoA oxidase